VRFLDVALVRLLREPEALRLLLEAVVVSRLRREPELLLPAREEPLLLLRELRAEELLLRLALRDDLARAVVRLLLRLPFFLPCWPVRRLISLLKLLCAPPAVSSCTSSARLLSSNFSKNSSHEISSSDSAPL
jgi:hypothetical protein